VEKRVLVDTWQKVVKDDFLNFGLFPQASFDTLVGNLLIPDLGFDGFAASQSTSTVVLLATGHVYDRGKVYVNDTTGGTTVDLSTNLPAVAKKIVTIVGYGTDVDAQTAARTFLTDPEERTTISRETATQKWRWANISKVAGDESADPQKPQVPAYYCPIAYVTLTTAGIESIVRATEYEVPTLRDADTRLNNYDLWKTAVGGRLDTLASDLVALGSRIKGLAQWSFVHAIAADLARTKDLLRVPDTYVMWGADHFLTDDDSDDQFVDWLSWIEEGARFPAAATQDSQLGLLNPYDALVINSSNTLLPAWESATRIVNVEAESGSEVSISQYQYQTVNYVKKTMSRQRLRYGTPYTICSNSYYWDAQTNNWQPGFVGVVDYINWTFIRDTGETYNILGIIEDAPGHYLMRLQQVWIDMVEEPYWDIVTTDHSISGSVLGESFLNSQDGWLESVEVYFSRVAASASVTMLICETTNGAPDLSKVLATSTVEQADMHVATAAMQTSTKFSFQPTFLGRGRYAFVLVTAGNHYVWCLDDTNFIAGTMFYSLDGAWSQGDLTKDIACKINFCKFSANQTKVTLNPVGLQNGIAAIDVNARAFTPSGCQLTFEVQKNGVWYPLANPTNSDSGGGPSVIFTGLPEQLPFRASFVGTEWVQPALGVASNSRVRTWRPRSDMKHISAIRTMPSPIDEVSVEIRLEGWRGTDATDPWLEEPPGAGHNALNTVRIRLMTGASYATLTEPSSYTYAVAPDDPDNTLIIKATWDLHAKGINHITTYRWRIDGAVDNVLTTFHVAERIDVGNLATA
jgi:hypothetical protein